jgi:hypothetical protein
MEKRIDRAARSGVVKRFDAKGAAEISTATVDKTPCRAGRPAAGSRLDAGFSRLLKA